MGVPPHRERAVSLWVQDRGGGVRVERGRGGQRGKVAAPLQARVDAPQLELGAVLSQVRHARLQQVGRQVQAAVAGGKQQRPQPLERHCTLEGLRMNPGTS